MEKNESGAMLPEPNDLKSVDHENGFLSSASADYLLDRALFALDDLYHREDPQRPTSYKYLSSLWRYFSIYRLDPISVAKPEDNKATGSGSAEPFPKIIRLKDGWRILAFSDGLITSAGENYGSYSTGPLLRTVDYMIDYMIEEGAKKVIFSGAWVAKRFAWLKCRHYGIETRFNPKQEDYKCQKNIEHIDSHQYASLIANRRRGGAQHKKF